VKFVPNISNCGIGILVNFVLHAVFYFFLCGFAVFGLPLRPPLHIMELDWFTFYLFKTRLNFRATLIALFHYDVTSKQSIVSTLRIMVVGGGQNDNNTKKNTIKLHLQNRGREPNNNIMP
jgi:hypothetical protein